MSYNNKQLDFLSTDSNNSPPRVSRIGLIVNYRRLFGAMESGWLSPLPSLGGVLLSAEAYIREREESVADNPICVGIQLDVQKLPDLDVQILCGEEWKPSHLSEIESAEQVVYWPGVLPTFAISELTVSTEEELVRLKGLAQQVSNVDFSSISIGIGAVHAQNIGCDTPRNKKTTELTVPSDVDATHGALSMAVWAIPSVDPWMDVLTESLVSGHTKQLRSAVKKVKAGWWEYPPWQTHTLKDPHRKDLQVCFWWAAIEVFRKQSTEKYTRPQELAEQIVNSVLSIKQTNKQKKIWKEATSKWLRDTISILRSETVLQLNDWKDHPVELVIQMVITRSDSVKFKTWFKDMPDLPPVIGWSAAVLCGLFQGYRRLDTQFRGGVIQRELLSIHALRMLSSKASDMKWPSYDAEKIHWRKDKDTNLFMLSWGDKEFTLRSVKERAAWYAADFKDNEVQSQAQSMANKLGWLCIDNWILFKDDKLSLSGSGDIKVRANKTSRNLVVRGEVSFQLPENYSIEQTLDVKKFCQLVVVGRGVLDPPPIQKSYNTQDKTTVRDGLVYIPDFVTEEEEKELIGIIDNGKWLEDTEMKRRVQHYGWKYNYKARQIDASSQIGKLPSWAQELATKLHSRGLVNTVPDQVIVNEYEGNQGIGKHIDSDSFADDIATISLLESWEMIFRKGKGKENKIIQLLEQRSVAVMSGDARYKWSHEIPKRQKESGRKRRRRISLTFRKVIVQ